MADTRTDVPVAAATWTNLYSGSGITVGVAVDIWNKGSSAAVVAIKSTAPSGTTTGVPLPVGGYLRCSSGASGLFAYSPDGKTSILVQD